METRQSEAAQHVYDAVTQFEPLLHYNDGDRADSQTTAAWLRKAQDKLTDAIAHLNSVPFQPDR